MVPPVNSQLPLRPLHRQPYYIYIMYAMFSNVELH